MVLADMESLFTCEDWGRAFTKNLSFSYVKGSQLPIIIFQEASNLIFQYLITISEKMHLHSTDSENTKIFFFFCEIHKGVMSKIWPFYHKKIIPSWLYTENQETKHLFGSTLPLYSFKPLCWQIQHCRDQAPLGD